MAAVDPKADLITEYVEKFATIDGRVVTQQLYDIYIEALSGFEMRKVEKGLKQALKEVDRWPWPGTLAEFIENEV